MILLHCPCGMDSTVDDSLAEKKVRCPGCNRILDVPPAGRKDLADPDQPKFRGFTSKAVGILLGLLLLATLAVPLEITETGIQWVPEKVADLWQNISLDAWTTTHWKLTSLIGLPAIGLLVLLGGLIFRRLPLAVVYIVGAAGLVVLAAGLKTYSRPLLVFAFLDEASVWLIPAVLVFLLANSLRAKMGGRAVICVFQILLALAVVALAGYGLYQVAPDLPDQIYEIQNQFGENINPEQAEDGYVAFLMSIFLVLRPVVLTALLVLASLFALLHGVAFGKTSRGPARIAMVLTVIGMMYWLVTAMVFVPGSAYLQISPESIWHFLGKQLQAYHSGVFYLSLLLLPVAAISGLIADVAGALGARPTWYGESGGASASDAKPAKVAAKPAAPAPRPPARPTPAKGQSQLTPSGGLTPSQRLDRLKALRDQDKITEEEYKAKRNEILEDL
ncbi:MAG: SHOCT domain-containing protein [Planctomycetota bacterium]